MIVDMFGIHFQCDDEDMEPTRDLTTKGLTSNIEKNSELRSEVNIRIYTVLPLLQAAASNFFEDVFAHNLLSKMRLLFKVRLLFKGGF